jgi:uncharacterized membrane protein YcaP (DUF421 family)
MEILNNSYIRIVLSSIAVYLFIVAAIRIFGKKELTQLSVIDLVFVLLISNAVQNAMVDAKLQSLLSGLVAAGSLFLLNYSMKQLQFRFPKFSRFVQGETLMLVYKGRVLKSHMLRARITKDELMEAIREHGIKSLEEVDLAILEVDGNISILSHDFSRKSSRRRKAHKIIAKQS